jgi:hypothetical protein
VSATTDASGDLTITHGLGVTPSSVQATYGSSGSAQVLAVHTITSTTFKIRFRLSNTGAATASAAVVAYWLAFA